MLSFTTPRIYKSIYRLKHIQDIVICCFLFTFQKHHPFFPQFSLFTSYDFTKFIANIKQEDDDFGSEYPAFDGFNCCWCFALHRIRAFRFHRFHSLLCRFLSQRQSLLFVNFFSPKVCFCLRSRIDSCFLL